MRSPAGYTLIELLVVISIISTLALVSFINFKNFSNDQVTIKATEQIQDLMRLAQSNATSSALCNGQHVKSWNLNFLADSKTIQLNCDQVCTTPCTPTNFLQRTYTLDANARIDTITGYDCGGANPINPLTLTYSPLVGTLSFSSNPALLGTCAQSASWTFTLKNTQNNSTKSFKINKGGAIDVQ